MEQISGKPTPDPWRHQRGQIPAQAAVGWRHAAADVNNDSSVTSLDALKILQSAGGAIDL